MTMPRIKSKAVASDGLRESAGQGRLSSNSESRIRGSAAPVKKVNGALGGQPLIRPRIDPPDFDKVPRALREPDSWLLWKAGPLKEDGRFDKLPYYANGKLRHGKQGGQSDLAQLVSLKEARAAFERGGYDGIGLAMHADHGLVGIDLDGCVDSEMEVADWAAQIVDASGETYWEVSPSGTGLRGFVLGRMRDQRKKPVEVFCDKGFLTITGKSIGGTGVVDMTADLESVLESKLAPQPVGPPRKTLAVGTFDFGDEMQVQKLDSAMQFIADHGGADDYDKFLRLGIALGRASNCSDRVWHAYVGWAKCSPKFEDEATEKQMRRFFYEESQRDHPSPVTVASIFQWAKDLGWKWEPPDNGRTILLREGGLPDFIDKATALLAPAGVYQRAPGQLVRILRYDQSALASVSTGYPETAGEIRRAPEQAVIEAFDADVLRVLLGRVAEIYKRDGRSKDWRQVDCPLDYARALLKLGQWENVPVLKGIVNGPTLRADGSIAQTPGYDAQSGLYLNLKADDDWPPIPEHPTRASAEAALGDLVEPFKEFPFANDAAVAATIAAVLTIMVRPLMDTAPLIAVDAPTSRTGKGLLCDIIGMIACGHSLAKAGMEGSEETGKQVTAALLAGDTTLCYDNVERGAFVKDRNLDRALTSGDWESRILGVSKNVKLPFRITVFLTGNNFTVHTDLVERSLFIRLDPKCERPGEREFERPALRQWVRTRRKELVTAALTILRAYIVSGKRTKVTPFGGFEDWSRWVREPLMWLGMDDPLATRTRMRGTDPEQEERASVYIKLHEDFEGRKFTSNEVVEQIKKTRDTEMHAFFGDGKGHLTPHSAGLKLRACVDVMASGLRLARAGKDAHSNKPLFRVIEEE